MRRLAEAAGYANYRGVNLQYGKLAYRLAKAMGRTPPQPALQLLAAFIPPREVSNQEYLIKMCPTFAEALKVEGWVK